MDLKAKKICSHLQEINKGFLKNEIETKRSIFLSLLEPLVIIFMGGFIMLIVLAILIPIMQMNTLSLG